MALRRPTLKSQLLRDETRRVETVRCCCSTACEPGSLVAWSALGTQRLGSARGERPAKCAVQTRTRTTPDKAGEAESERGTRFPCTHSEGIRYSVSDGAVRSESAPRNFSSFSRVAFTATSACLSFFLACRRLATSEQAILNLVELREHQFALHTEDRSAQ